MRTKQRLDLLPEFFLASAALGEKACRASSLSISIA
jgi:hypothetical protein